MLCDNCLHKNVCQKKIEVVEHATFVELKNSIPYYLFECRDFIDERTVYTSPQNDLCFDMFTEDIDKNNIDEESINFIFSILNLMFINFGKKLHGLPNIQLKSCFVGKNLKLSIRVNGIN